MDPPFRGEVFALLAALTWATALVLFKRSGETVSPLSLNLFKNVVACLLLGATLVFFPSAESVLGATDLSELSNLTWADFGILILSGILGIAMADTLLFYGLNRIGVGLVTVAECSYTPLVMLFAWSLLSEELAPNHLLGGGLVLSGLFISSTHAPPPGRTRGELLFGTFLTVLAIALMAVGIVWAKPVLEVAPLLPATMLRLIGGTAILCVLLAVDRRRAAHFAVFRPKAAWRTMLPASILGTYFAMIFWVGGFKYTSASVAAVLNQTSTIFALIMATIILKEPFTRRKLLAAVLAFGGVVIVTGLWTPW